MTERVKTIITPSDFISNFIYVSGKPFKGKHGFDYWPFLKDIYNDGNKYMVLKCSRQCSKSTTLGNKLLMYCAVIPGFKSLYIAPTQDKVQTFSRDRLLTVIEESPVLSKLTSRKYTNNVFLKMFANMSVITLRSSHSSSSQDPARGVVARMISIDEIQDIGVDHVPVILECAATFPTNRLVTFAGTPLSFDNVIEYYWEKLSSMQEWMTKCSCGKWNMTEMENIGIEGYICKHCSKALDIRTGQWVSHRDKAIYSGYHINQLMTPYTWEDWGGLKTKLTDYGIPRFKNEVLGESFDSGTKPISRVELLACCDKNRGLMHHPPPELNNKITIAGIDWGTGDKAYTVLVVMRFDRNFKYEVLYAKRYIGLEASVQDIMLDDIKRKLHLFNINMIGADYGFGFYYNFYLAQEFGSNLVVPIMYADRLKEKAKYDKKGKNLIVNKIMVLEDVFQLIKRKEISFPCPEEWMDPFGEDILNEFIEGTYKIARRRFSHSPESTDDTLHALAYAIIAAQYLHPRPDLFSPASAASISK